MSNMADLSDLVREIKEASSNITASDTALGKRLDKQEAAINELSRRPAALAPISIPATATSARTRRPW